MPKNKIFRSAVLFAIGSFYIYYYVRHADHEFYFDGLILLPFVLAGLIIYPVVFFKDRKDYFKNKKLIEWLPTFIGVVLILVLLITVFIFQQRDKSSSKFYCTSKNSDFSGVSIDFREDGTYKLTSWCMGEDIYRGNYSIHENLIEIDTEGIEKILESNRLVIIPETEIYEKKTVHQKSVYQIDSKGNRIERAIAFTVIEK